MCFVQHPRGMFLFDGLRTHSINFSNLNNGIEGQVRIEVLAQGIPVALSKIVSSLEENFSCSSHRGTLKQNWPAL